MKKTSTSLQTCTLNLPPLHGFNTWRPSLTKDVSGSLLLHFLHAADSHVAYSGVEKPHRTPRTPLSRRHAKTVRASGALAAQWGGQLPGIGAVNLTSRLLQLCQGKRGKAAMQQLPPLVQWPCSLKSIFGTAWHLLLPWLCQAPASTGKGLPAETRSTSRTTASLAE